MILVEWREEIRIDMEQEKRLEAFEKMLAAVRKSYDDTVSAMEQLKQQDKTKSATYRQLMGNKVMYQNMLSLYEIYGIL